MSTPKATGWTGWVVFAGVILMVIGIFSAIQGLVALIGPSSYYVVTEGSLWLLDVTGWGWWNLIIGLLLVVRWLLLYTFETDYTSRVPSLLAGIGLLILAVQVWSVAFLADLQSSNRRMLAELRLRSKRLEYGDDPPPSGRP